MTEIVLTERDHTTLDSLEAEITDREFHLADIQGNDAQTAGRMMGSRWGGIWFVHTAAPTGRGDRNPGPLPAGTKVRVHCK